uniref:Uncharacterized protein n=1 Tax=Anopheles culicifacies TaxID=139723 RepID=A0A182MPE5_9DIPT
MLRNWSSFLYLLLPLACIFTYKAEGLSCKFCQSSNNYNNCINAAGLVECNGALVNMTHLLLSPHNPSLAKVPAANQYQCFQVNYTANGVWNYHMGCSFAGSNICDGWKVLSQCKVSNGNEGQPSSTVKMSGKPTPKLAATSVTENGVSKSLGEKASTPAAKQHSSTGFSTTTVSIRIQSNSSSVSSTLPPKITQGTKDSIQRKTPSKASVCTLQWEVLVTFWILILVWRHS